MQLILIHSKNCCVKVTHRSVSNQFLTHCTRVKIKWHTYVCHMTHLCDSLINKYIISIYYYERKIFGRGVGAAATDLVFLRFCLFLKKARDLIASSERSSFPVSECPMLLASVPGCELWARSECGLARADYILWMITRCVLGTASSVWYCYSVTDL